MPKRSPPRGPARPGRPPGDAGCGPRRGRRAAAVMSAAHHSRSAGDAGGRPTWLNSRPASPAPTCTDDDPGEDEHRGRRGGQPAGPARHDRRGTFTPSGSVRAARAIAATAQTASTSRSPPGGRRHGPAPSAARRTARRPAAASSTGWTAGRELGQREDHPADAEQIRYSRFAAASVASARSVPAISRASPLNAAVPGQQQQRHPAPRPGRRAGVQPSAAPIADEQRPPGAASTTSTRQRLGGDQPGRATAATRPAA